MARPENPVRRKVLHYLGMVLLGAGVTFFLGTFFTGPSIRDDVDEFRRKSGVSMAVAVIGMVLMAGGATLVFVGRLGGAGPGLALDPERTRKDSQPRVRAGHGAEAPRSRAPHVKVRCRACRALNDEEARFCDQCGAEL
jgi:hypothetical protein